jgi:hypothetical protein
MDKYKGTFTEEDIEKLKRDFKCEDDWRINLHKLFALIFLWIGVSGIILSLLNNCCDSNPWFTIFESLIVFMLSLICVYFGLFNYFSWRKLK